MRPFKNHIPIILALGLTEDTDRNGLTRNAIAKRQNKRTSSIYKSIKPLEEALIVKVSREYPHPYTGKICKEYILTITGIVEYLNLQSVFMQFEDKRRGVIKQISNSMKNYGNFYDYPIFHYWSEIEEFFNDHDRDPCAMLALSACLIKGGFSIPFTYPKHENWVRDLKMNLRSNHDLIQDLTMMFFQNVTVAGHERFNYVSKDVQELAQLTIKNEKEKLDRKKLDLDNILESLT